VPAQNLVAHIANEFLSEATDDVQDVVTFVESPWGLNIRLLPAQRFILKSFYGMPLDDNQRCIQVPDITNERILWNFTEKQFLHWLYEEGRCNTDTVEGKMFPELILVIGRRGTKSSIASFISNYELYKLIKRGDPSEFYGMPSRSQMAIVNVAPTDEQASIVFGMIQGMAMQCPYMRDRGLHQTMTYFDLQTDADRSAHGKPRASLLSLAGGCSSNSLRGRNGIVVIMDEMAHFIDNGGRFSGEEVYKALTPSIASFKGDGKKISISSPYAKFGKFYELYNQSFNEPDHTLMFKMHSAMANPEIPSEILKTERKRNRISFMSEYGGEFSDSVTAWIEDEVEFMKCVVPNSISTPRGSSDFRYYVGIDIGFKNDGTAISIVHKEKNKIILDYAEVWYSAAADIWDLESSIYHSCNKYAHLELLRMSDFLVELNNLARWFPIAGGVFDRVNGYALAELLMNNGLTQFQLEHFSDTLNSEVFHVTQRLYAEELIEIYDHPVLVPEMLTLEAERRARNKIIVEAPNRMGAHDDISDAYTRAVWLCNKSHLDKVPNLSTGAGGQIGSSAQNMNGGNGPVTRNAFELAKRKAHGRHPRIGGRRKTMPGSVRR